MTSTKLKESSPVYEEIDVDNIAHRQTHLTMDQRKQLAQLLRKFTRLLRGKLGRYPHRKMHLNVDKEDLKKLKFQRPYLLVGIPLVR